MGLTEILHNLLHATYGRDVRQSLHDGVKMAVETADETEKAQVKLNGKFEAQIKNMTIDSPSDAEIVAARTDASGKEYETLGKRLDASDANVNEVQTLLMSGVARVASFSGTFKKNATKQGTINIQKSKDVEIEGRTYKFVPIGVVGCRANSGVAASGAYTVQSTFVCYEAEIDQAYVTVRLNEAPNMDVTVELDVLYVLSLQDMDQLLV